MPVLRIRSAGIRWISSAHGGGGTRTAGRRATAAGAVHRPPARERLGARPPPRRPGRRCRRAGSSATHVPRAPASPRGSPSRPRTAPPLRAEDVEHVGDGREPGCAAGTGVDVPARAAVAVHLPHEHRLFGDLLTADAHAHSPWFPVHVHRAPPGELVNCPVLVGRWDVGCGMSALLQQTSAGPGTVAAVAGALSTAPPLRTRGTSPCTLPSSP